MIYLTTLRDWRLLGLRAVVWSLMHPRQARTARNEGERIARDAIVRYS